MIEQYKRDGFLVVPCGFDVERAFNVKDTLADFQTATRVSVDAFRSRAKVYSRLALIVEWFSAMMYYSVALGVREPMFQTFPVLHAMGFDQSFRGTEAHQDFPALQSSLNTVVAWVPLHAVGLDNYPLEVVPGSHLKGLLPAKPGEHYSEVDTTGMEFVPVEVPAGSVLFMSVFLVHRTRTPGKGVRVALSHRFEDADCPWFIKHGYPSAQSRVISRDVKVAPTIDEVRRVFK